MPLTKRQSEILAYLQQHIQDQGYAPSFEEIAERFGFQSLATVHEHLTNLERKGYIRRSYNESRSIEVLPPRGTSAASEIPLLGKVAAGTPIESLMHQETIAVPDQMLPRRGPNYALRVQGTSMIDEHIVDGDVVVVHGKQTAENGEMVIALVNGSEATVKKFYREAGGWIRLQPANATMQPMRFQERDVLIQGVVVGVIRQVLSRAAWRGAPVTTSLALTARRRPRRGAARLASTADARASPRSSASRARAAALGQRPPVARHVERGRGVQQHGAALHGRPSALEQPLHRRGVLRRARRPPARPGRRMRGRAAPGHGSSVDSPARLALPRPASRPTGSPRPSRRRRAAPARGRRPGAPAPPRPAVRGPRSTRRSPGGATPAGFASGPSRFMIVGTPSSFRTGPACRMAG